jgi:hypothetical protein
VPPLPRNPQVPIIDNITIAAADAIQIARLFVAPPWGLFNLDGSNALQVSSTVTAEMRGDANVTTAPLEAGGFVSYNKVTMPRLIRMTFAVAAASFLPAIDIVGLITGFDAAAFLPAPFGSPDIDALLGTLEFLRTSPTLLVAVTPNAVYPNVTVVHYEYRRSAQNNATMLTTDVWLEEIRLPGEAKFSAATTQSPSSSDPVNAGTVQPGAPITIAEDPTRGGVS